MTPNLFLATQKVFSPHKWFKTTKSERSVRQTEVWEDGPVPGLYEYIPGRGRYLIATLKDTPTDAELKASEGGPVLPAASSPPKEYVQLESPVPITYSRAVKRWFLDPDYKLRKKYGMIKNDRGKRIHAGFFRTDDHEGVAWVHCWDEEGTFIPGPYQKWCIDGETKEFRHMRKRDDPGYIRSRNTSRNNSPDREADTHSQDSMSTEIRTSRPGSTKNGPSTPSTRPNSIRYMSSNPASRPGSQRPSRQNSPRRNNSIPLEEAKASLRRMAREHEEAVAAAVAARGVQSRGIVRSVDDPRRVWLIKSLVSFLCWAFLFAEYACRVAGDFKHTAWLLRVDGRLSFDACLHWSAGMHGVMLCSAGLSYNRS